MITTIDPNVSVGENRQGQGRDASSLIFLSVRTRSLTDTEC